MSRAKSDKHAAPREEADAGDRPAEGVTGSAEGGGGTGVGVAPEGGGAGEGGPAPSLPPQDLMAMADRVAEEVMGRIAEAPPPSFAELVATLVLQRLTLGDLSPALVDALLVQLAQRELLVTEAAIADLVGRGAARAGSSTAVAASPDRFTLRELCELHGVAEDAVYASNLVTGTIVTVAGQKLRLD